MTAVMVTAWGMSFGTLFFDTSDPKDQSSAAGTALASTDAAISSASKSSAAGTANAQPALTTVAARSTIMCDSMVLSSYPNVLKELLPGYRLTMSQVSFFPGSYDAEGGELCDAQAQPIIENFGGNWTQVSGTALAPTTQVSTSAATSPDHTQTSTTALAPTTQFSNAVTATSHAAAKMTTSSTSIYWYPQYLSTVVIAIDRDRCSKDIKGWRDLESADCSVGMMLKGIWGRSVSGAISYGLDRSSGEKFSIDAGADLIGSLSRKGLLVERGKWEDEAVIVCLDNQAAAMKK